MASHDFLQETRLMLQAFEKSQAAMLHFNVKLASEEFSMEIEEFTARFDAALRKIRSAESISSRDRILLSKQLERLNKFLKELKIILKELKGEIPPTPQKLIFLFERQYVFKTILRRHLNDYAKLIF